MHALSDAWDIGPVVRTLDTFYEHRSAFWSTFSPGTPPSQSRLWQAELEQYLQSFERVCVWFTPSLDNQVFLCLVLALLQRAGVPDDRIDVVFVQRDFYGNPIVYFSDFSSSLGIDRTHINRRPITREEIDATRAAWLVLTSPSPESLDSWLHCDEPSVFNARPCLFALRGHFASASTGLNVWEERLLSFVSNEETRPATAISATLEKWPHELDLPGDFGLFQMLNKLDQISCANPLVQSQGDRLSMRSTRFRLTSFGRSVLDGRANHLASNEIDWWVGGVHSSSKLGQVWVRDEGKLRRW